MYIQREREMQKGVAEWRKGGDSNLVTSVSLETLLNPTNPLPHHFANYTPYTLLPPKLFDGL
jgi:hypothetical protein